uniref:Gamma-tubulin complex component n=1 Tax=Heterorhabditis bacteriophora TaxID=37862 RepID=A0A1I7XTI3_HETBA
MKKEEDDGIFELIDFDYDVDLVKEEVKQEYNIRFVSINRVLGIFSLSTTIAHMDQEKTMKKKITYYLADSAVQSARNLPVKKSSHNGFRNSAGVYSICHRAILLKNLYETKLINYRARGEQFILCDERLLSHLLNFIDVPPEVKTDDDPPLFSVMNDAVFVNTRYYFHDSDIRHKYSHSYLCNTASPYLNTHIQLREIIQFISDIVTIEDLAPFWRTHFTTICDLMSGVMASRFIPFGHLRRSFRAAANQITSELSNQLIKDIRSFGLMEFWSDMKEVTVGRIAHFYASLIYGADASQIVSMDVAQAFYSAVNLSYIPPNRALRWRRVQISEGDHRVECLIERPLNFVINPSFIAVMNDCMNYMFKIYRILEVLTGVYSIFDIYAAFLEQAQTVEEARIAAENAQLELQALVSHEYRFLNLNIILFFLISFNYIFFSLDYIIRSVSNDLTEDNLSRWEATTLRSIDFLTLMGRHMSKDTVFHALCARLQYSRRRNFLIQQYD